MVHKRSSAPTLTMVVARTPLSLIGDPLGVSTTAQRFAWRRTAEKPDSVVTATRPAATLALTSWPSGTLPMPICSMTTNGEPGTTGPTRLPERSASRADTVMAAEPPTAITSARSPPSQTRLGIPGPRQVERVSSAPGGALAAKCCAAAFHPQGARALASEASLARPMGMLATSTTSSAPSTAHTAKRSRPGSAATGPSTAATMVAPDAWEPTVSAKAGPARSRSNHLLLASLSTTRMKCCVLLPSSATSTLQALRAPAAAASAGAESPEPALMLPSIVADEQAAPSREPANGTITLWLGGEAHGKSRQ
mmetsp:Transcript_26508/g.99731  ORF Transcript_26508/g.99731 Transcript_26508/m.99731 type:complete len:309 (-) Transcript_26508:117-1043(-)